MPRVSTFPRKTSVLVCWPLIFGATLTLLRLLVLLLFGARNMGPAELLGLALGLPGQIAFGLLLALPLWGLRQAMGLLLTYTATTFVVLLNVAAFHFEAAYGRLPGLSLLYYVAEMRYLGASTRAYAPWLSVALELGVTVAILVVSAEWLRRGERREAWERGGRIGPAGRKWWLAAAAAGCLVSVVITLTFLFAPAFVPRGSEWLSRTPIFWAIQSWGARQASDPGRVVADRGLFLDFQRRIGHPLPFGGGDERYPLCGAGPRFPWREGNGRSVIFLILESVGTGETDLVHQGQPVMPQFRRMAARSVEFRNIKASGTKSSQAMPGLFAGVPPQPYKNLLWQSPLNNLAGFPLDLKTRGYRTAYFHGGDLSFEQQRPFLRMVGFDTIVEPEGPELVGWGESDDLVLGKLQRWVTAHRDRPYLATLFTLSTHDPFLLPEGRARVFKGEGPWADYVESLRFTDEALGRFYDWYLEHEAPRGTLLVITGDHVPYLAEQRPTEEAQITRFDVPLLIHGVDHGRERAKDRSGAHFDIPATILGALNLSPGPCDQGLDLLAPDAHWPGQRILYSVSGDDLENIHVWFEKAHVHLNLATRTSTVTDESTGKSIGAEEARELRARAARFLGLAGAISSYLVTTDGFAPPPSTTIIRRPALPSIAAPFFVAHRGQSRGTLAPDLQNKLPAIEQAIADGMTWIEVDVQLSRDDQPVLVHDTTIGGREVAALTLAEIRAHPGMDDVLTLEELLATLPAEIGLFVEIKPQRNFHRSALLARKTAAMLAPRTKAGRVVMDSFSPIIAASLKQACRCPVGVDAPTSAAIEQPWVDDQARNGMDWIYVTFRQATPELIRYAHSQGLRVSVYTANHPGELAHLRTEWPDAVITDRAALVSELQRQ